MELVVIFWTLLAVVVIVQVLGIVNCVKNGKGTKPNGGYSNTVIEKTDIVMEAIKKKEIKKHILTNSAKKYDSKKALAQYRSFLKSELMSDIMSVNEERYNG